MSTNENLDMKAAAKVKHKPHHYKKYYASCNTNKMDEGKSHYSEFQRMDPITTNPSNKLKMKPLNGLELDVFRRKQFNKTASQHMAPLGAPMTDEDIRDSFSHSSSIILITN